jgi:Mg-chelatase subunit ChlD
MTTTTTANDNAMVASKTALDRLNKTAAASSLDDLIRMNRRSLMLVDVSGSMGARVIRTGRRRIDELRTVVNDLRSTGDVPVAAFGTYEGVEVVEGEIPEPCGSTPLADAIDFGTDNGATHMVVVTDGVPDSQEDAFGAAARFGNPIDVFFIGDANDIGAKFCKRLAEMTGGKCSLTTLANPKELASQIRGLLGDGR